MIQNFYQELDIPEIPNHLIHTDPNYVVDNYTNIWNEVKTDVYRQFKVTPQLIEYLQPYFNFDISNNLKYQILTHNIPIHKDIGRIKAINYLIDSGGRDVKTTWYTENLEILYELVIPCNRWHVINTEIKHGVHGIIDKRLSLTISLQK